VSILSVPNGSSRSKHFLGAELVTAFLNPEVDEDDYMAMPDGVEVPAGGP
jgi:hypothetical protein